MDRFSHVWIMVLMVTLLAFTVQSSPTDGAVSGEMTADELSVPGNSTYENKTITVCVSTKDVNGSGTKYHSKVVAYNSFGNQIGRPYYFPEGLKDFGDTTCQTYYRRLSRFFEVTHIAIGTIGTDVVQPAMVTIRISDLGGPFSKCFDCPTINEDLECYYRHYCWNIPCYPTTC